jgi:hypothetical protein
MTTLATVLVMAAWVASAATPQGVSPGAVERMTGIPGKCPTFIWETVDGATAYELAVYELAQTLDGSVDLELTEDREVLRAAVSGRTNSWTPELGRCFAPGGSYVWFVRTVLEEDGYPVVSEWSEGRFFTVAAAPTTEELERALDVLHRWYGGQAVGPDGIEGADPEPARRTARELRRSESAAAGYAKAGQRSVITGATAVRGEMTDPAGETYGVTGISSSPDGAGFGAANTAGGADLVLDGSFDLEADTELSQSGIDRPSAGAQTFSIDNSGGGGMTLLVDGVEAVTTATDRDALGALACGGGELAKWSGSAWICAGDDDTPPRDAGNQLSLSGNDLDVVEGPGSGLDADSVDGLDSSAFSHVTHLHDGRYFTEAELSTSGAGGVVHWNNLAAVPLGFADGVDNDTTYSFGRGLTTDSGRIVIDPAAFRLWLSTLDSAGNVGEHTSLAIGADGLGLIAYVDDGNDDLKVAHCADLLCTTADQITTLDSAGLVGYSSSVEIGADGLGLISYNDWTNGDLKVAHCDDVACTSATISTLDSAGVVGRYTSVAIGADGLGLISYHDYTDRDLKVAHCDNVACSSATVTALDLWTDVGEYSSIAIGSDGLGLVSYIDVTSHSLKVAHCQNTACTGATLSVLDSSVAVALHTSVAIGGDGLGLISYFDNTNDDLKVAHCDNTACTSATTTTVDSAGAVGLYSSIAIGDDGLAVISYQDQTNFDLKVAHCHNTPCTSASTTTVDSGGGVGEYTSVAIGSDGLGLISYHDASNQDLKVAHLPYGY